MRILLTVLAILLAPHLLSAQNSKLAQQYFQNGEYEKAGAVYQKLYEKNFNDYYFNRYIDCMLALEQFDKCEAVIKKQIKKQPKSVQLLVAYGNLFERQYDDDKANAQYRKAINKVEGNRFSVTKLANAFTSLTKYDMAIETYERGGKLMKNDRIFAYNLGDLYRRKGDNPKMILNYLNSLGEEPSRLGSLKTVFQRYLYSEEDYTELQAQLYERIQENEEALHYSELLVWVFIQQKDYNGALRQVKALDMQLKENGGRVYNLAEIAANDQDYDTAIKAYDYIVQNKGQASSYYIEAKRESLTCKRSKLVDGYKYEEEDLLQLGREYEGFLEEFGRNRATASIIMELAELETFYLKNLPKASALLKELIEFQGLKKQVKAKAKLALADLYLMQGERWESTLLYSQVDKEFEDDLLGHEARFRNSKLSYYFGDFQWAQTQFDILKASTSKLIANDALDLSIFIMDNLGLDTTAAPLQKYADAELLVFQNDFTAAFSKMDSIKTLYPEHSLEDDVLYLKADIFTRKRDFAKAAQMYQAVIDNFLDGIRADNSMYKLAELYETHLNDPEKAKALYERIFTELSGSTFAVDARKRFRALRGDEIQ